MAVVVGILCVTVVLLASLLVFTVTSLLKQNRHLIHAVMAKSGRELGSIEKMTAPTSKPVEITPEAFMEQIRADQARENGVFQPTGFDGTT